MPHGADKEKGFYFVMRSTFLLILKFYCSQRISKYYQRIWTPCLNHLGIVDFHSLMGGVSHCISFQFILDSLKIKSRMFTRFLAPTPHLQPWALRMWHMGGFLRLGQGWGLACGPSDRSLILEFCCIGNSFPHSFRVFQLLNTILPPSPQSKISILVLKGLFITSAAAIPWLFT